MAVIQYQCDTCKREIDLGEFARGLEVMSRCIITNGCRGKLFRINRLQDFIRGNFPDRVAGLIDYSARRVLFNHTQSVPSTTWFVTHNLGVIPSVEIEIEITSGSQAEFTSVPCQFRTVEGSFNLIETTDFTVTVTGPNTLTITFNDPRSGVAQLVARSSAPTVTQTAVDADQPTIQLSTGSLITIATLDSVISPMSPVPVDIAFTPPGSVVPVINSYIASTIQDNNSPWFDFINVLIDGKRYTVRNIDTFVPGFIDGTIPDGSAFYFSSINSQLPSLGEVNLLLSLSPFATVDKITNSFIDVSRVTALNSQVSFFHNNRELFAFTGVVSSVFPNIREI